jgi:hypothetical protein
MERFLVLHEASCQNELIVGICFHCSGEVYKITFPAYYVRGILIGVMRMEIRL